MALPILQHIAAHHLFLVHILICILGCPIPARAASSSPKRGLIAIPASDAADTNKPLVAPGTDITWYYSYGADPTAVAIDNASIQFVPMLWGTKPTDTTQSFLDVVHSLLATGSLLNAVLAFNEPDICNGGGSCVSPSDAAGIWQDQIEPLKQQGLSLGSPAVTNADSGFIWLAEWFAACSGKCHPDFMAVHYYGPFDGLQSHVELVHSLFSHNMTGGIWVTEFAYPGQNASESEAFYNSSVGFLDGADYVARYAYFGSFKSSASNIGPDAAMINDNGALTNIGNWYVGGNTTASSLATGGFVNAVVWSVATAALTGAWMVL